MITAIWGSPQSGKTTIACELALACGAMGKKVCVISAEDFGEMGLRFGQVIPAERSILWVAKNPDEIRSVVYQVSDNIFLLAPSSSDSALSLTFSESQAMAILRTADAIYDNVIIDCTTWKGNAITGASISMAGTIILPIPGIVSALPWFIANQEILEQKKDFLLYVKNETATDFDYESLVGSLPGVAPAIAIPHIPKMTSMQNDGILVGSNKVINSSTRQFKKAINAIANVVIPKV